MIIHFLFFEDHDYSWPYCGMDYVWEDQLLLLLSTLVLSWIVGAGTSLICVKYPHGWVFNGSECVFLSYCSISSILLSNLLERSWSSSFLKNWYRLDMNSFWTILVSSSHSRLFSQPSSKWSLIRVCLHFCMPRTDWLDVYIGIGRLCVHLWTNHMHLNLILCVTGSQWSDLRLGSAAYTTALVQTSTN